MTRISTQPIERAALSLEGLSIGDAFGQCFFVDPGMILQCFQQRTLPAPIWRYTDDSEMALSVVDVLRRSNGIDQDALARSFATHYDPSRGYGPAMQGLLRHIRTGAPWQPAAAGLFAGDGSFGNGAAMRVAPIGGFFADNIDLVVEHARRAAEVTHTHPEGVAGAIAVAVAAAWAWRIGVGNAPSFASLIDLVLLSVPDSEVRAGLERALRLSPGAPARHGVALLGNGSDISAQDTVPYVIWCASSFLTDYEGALWHTVSGFGDVDTTCAMVGGIVALSVGAAGIPALWRERREPLPRWPFHDDQ